MGDYPRTNYPLANGIDFWEAVSAASQPCVYVVLYVLACFSSYYPIFEFLPQFGVVN